MSSRRAELRARRPPRPGTGKPSLSVISARWPVLEPFVIEIRVGADVEQQRMTSAQMRAACFVCDPAGRIMNTAMVVLWIRNPQNGKYVPWQLHAGYEWARVEQVSSGG